MKQQPNKPSNYFTRTPSNNGAKMLLKDPVTNEDTQDYLQVLGLESDPFRQALVLKHKRNMEILTLPESEQPAALEDAELDLYASLVTGWSFSEPCTKEAVRELLNEAPQVKSQVDKFAGTRANFIVRLSKN